MDEKAKKILSGLEAQCSKREYCYADMMTKAVKALDGDSETASEIVDSLVSDRFVDDGRYAAAYAREKASITGWGPVKIRYMLSRRGISKEHIDAALAETDSDGADTRLEKTLAAKWRTLEGDPQAKFKLIRFALSRGYEYDSVRQAVDRICHG